MDFQIKRLLLSLILGLGLTLTTVTLLDIQVWLSEGTSPAQAAGITRYVAPGGTDTSNICTNSNDPCATVQHAVDMANPEDEIRVAAGTYTDVSVRAAISQVVYIEKTVSIQGGYTTTNWITPDPANQPTILNAQGQGRVIYISGDISPTIEGLHLTGGDAADLGGTPDGSVSGSGGGVYVITATVVISHNIVFSNTAPVVGGGLFLWNSEATISGNTVLSNTAGGHGSGAGGGLMVYQGDATLTENTVTFNTTGFSGGGLVVLEGVATLNGNTVTSNTARYGGGLTFQSANTSLNENLISGNASYVANSGGCGGGMYLLGGTTSLTANIISANIADFVGGGLCPQAGDLTLIDNTVSANRADWYGGGLGNGLGFPDLIVLLKGNVITANVAGRSGGGLFLENSDITLNENQISSNEAGRQCGGASLEGEITATNNIVADNQAAESGSGLCLSSSSAHLLHTTVARNSGGDGAGISVFGSADLINTILVSQTVGISVPSGSSAALEATLWGTGTWANGADWSGAGSVSTGTLNIFGDPAFVDPDTGNYHLASGSAALDVGVDAGVIIDIDGEPRPFGVGFDLGADELQGPYQYYLPVMLRED